MPHFFLILTQNQSSAYSSRLLEAAKSSTYVPTIMCGSWRDNWIEETCKEDYRHQSSHHSTFNSNMMRKWICTRLPKSGSHLLTFSRLPNLGSHSRFGKLRKLPKFPCLLPITIKTSKFTKCSPTATYPSCQQLRVMTSFYQPKPGLHHLIFHQSLSWLLLLLEEDKCSYFTSKAQQEIETFPRKKTIWMWVVISAPSSSSVRSSSPSLFKFKL